MPIFAAAGQIPYRIIAKGSAAAFHAEIFDGAKLHYVQGVNEPINGDNSTVGDGPVEEDPGDEGGELGEGIGNEEEGPEEISEGDDDGSESDQRFAAMGNSVNARRIVLVIEEGEGYCKLLDAANKIDCLAEAYESIARGLSSEGDEGVVKQALLKAAADLDKIVRANIDTSVNLTRPTVKTRKINRTASRPLRAIKKASIPAANRQATAVVEELSTVLLRSAENTKKRNTYYAKIAQAVDSNKVLLRS